MGEKVAVDRSGPETDTWNKSFEISSVSRSDLLQAGFPEAVVVQLTDDQMARIAARMGDYYNNQGYWDDLVAATGYVTDPPNKEQPHG